MAVPTPKERWLRIFGRWFITPIYAIGHGLITTVAASGIVWLASLALPWLIPILIAVFLAETLVSIYLFKDSVPETLINIFLHNIFEGLSRPKQVLLAMGLISAAGAGVALAALVYTSGMSAFTSALAFLGISAPPVALIITAGFLAFVAFFALFSLLTKWIRYAIKNDIHEKIAEFFQELFIRDPQKLLAQQILENVFKLVFVFGIMAITIVGTIATLGTMQKGLFAFLSLIPSANLLACKISSIIIAYALMGSSRLPWILQTICSISAKIGEYVGYGIFRAGLFIAITLDLLSESETTLMSEEIEKETKSTEKSWAESTPLEKVLFVLGCAIKVLAALIHGFSFGALAQSGGGEVIGSVLNMTEDVAKTTAFLTGAGMSSTIAAGTFFAPATSSEESPPPPQQETSSDKESTPSATRQTTSLNH